MADVGGSSPKIKAPATVAGPLISRSPRPSGGPPASVPSDSHKAAATRPSSHEKRLENALADLGNAVPPSGGQPPLPQVDAGAEDITSMRGKALNLEGATKVHGDRTWTPKIDAAQEAAYVAALPPDQQRQYQQIKQTLNGNSAAQAQLALLVVDGKAKQTDTQGKTLLDDLARITQGPMTNGLSSRQVLTDAIADVTDPSTIFQGYKGTCTATSIQSELAQREPAEYARLVAGLATGDGKVTLQDGKTVLDSHQYYDGSQSTSEGLLSPALEEAEARHAGGHYNLKDDRIEFGGLNPFGFRNYDGAAESDVAAVESELFGGHYQNVSVGGGVFGIGSGMNPDEAMKFFTGATPDRPVLVDIDPPGIGQHEVQVVGYDRTKNEVTIRNPWGEVDTIPVDQFKQHLVSVAAPQ